MIYTTRIVRKDRFTNAQIRADRKLVEIRIASGPEAERLKGLAMALRALVVRGLHYLSFVKASKFVTLAKAGWHFTSRFKHYCLYIPGQRHATIGRAVALSKQLIAA